MSSASKGPSATVHYGTGGHREHNPKQLQWSLRRDLNRLLGSGRAMVCWEREGQDLGPAQMGLDPDMPLGLSQSKWWRCTEPQTSPLWPSR